MNITRTLISAAFSLSALAASAQTVDSFIHPEQGHWTSALSGRDTNQDGLMDYVYDSDQDVSWYLRGEIFSSFVTDFPSINEYFNTVNQHIPVPMYLADINGTNGMIDRLFFETLGNTFAADTPVNYGFFAPLLNSMIQAAPDVKLNTVDTLLGSSTGTSAGTLTLNVQTGQYLMNSNPDDVAFFLTYAKGDPYKAFAMPNPYSGLGGGVTAAVPEPSTLVLAMTGLLTASLAAYRRRPYQSE